MSANRTRLGPRSRPHGAAATRTRGDRNDAGSRRDLRSPPYGAPAEPRPGWLHLLAGWRATGSRRPEVVQARASQTASFPTPPYHDPVSRRLRPSRSDVWVSPAATALLDRDRRLRRRAVPARFHPLDRGPEHRDRASSRSLPSTTARRTARSTCSGVGRPAPIRVKVHTKPNGGQGFGEEPRPEPATGEWVTFTDSDDMLDPLLRGRRPVCRGPSRGGRPGGQASVPAGGPGPHRRRHPRRHQYRRGNRRRDLLDEPNAFPGSSTVSAVPARARPGTGPPFDRRVRPNFEDGHFTVRYLLALGHRASACSATPATCTGGGPPRFDAPAQPAGPGPVHERPRVRLPGVLRQRSRPMGGPGVAPAASCTSCRGFSRPTKTQRTEDPSSPSVIPSFHELLGQVLRDLDPRSSRRTRARRSARLAGHPCPTHTARRHGMPSGRADAVDQVMPACSASPIGSPAPPPEARSMSGASRSSPPSPRRRPILLRRDLAPRADPVAARGRGSSLALDGTPDEDPRPDRDCHRHRGPGRRRSLGPDPPTSTGA